MWTADLRGFLRLMEVILKKKHKTLRKLLVLNRGNLHTGNDVCAILLKNV